MSSLWAARKDHQKSPFEGVELPPNADEILRNTDFKEDDLNKRLKKFRSLITLDVLFTPLD